MFISLSRRVAASCESRGDRRARFVCAALAGAALLLAGCDAIVRQTDRDVAQLIRERQQKILEREADARLPREADWRSPGRDAYRKRGTPTTDDVPADFIATTQPAAEPAMPGRRMAGEATATAPVAAALSPTTHAVRRATIFTLIDALAYAQQNRREYQSAKERLYLSTLSLMLERHLWTPIFAQQFTTVYGNYGEARQFDQAMRFVHDMSVTQRLPFGGEVAARGVSTLIRDVKRSLTAEEGSRVEGTVNIPLLRGAGMVAQETLIQLERELTYSVRSFERFRRAQVVDVAREYFDLLRAKQETINSEQRYRRAIDDYERAAALEATGRGTVLDTQRAEQAMLSAENSLEVSRENFRNQADQFKLLIGMPVDEPLAADDLEDIATIERKIDDGEYPILTAPIAVSDIERAMAVALQRRLELLTLHDRVDDARRGVEISRNALLPRLDWQGQAVFSTDADRFSMSHFHIENTNWFTQIVLEVPWERTAERNALRQSLIEVRAAQRSEVQQAEEIRVEVRRTVNLLRLADISLAIQRRSVEVAERQREFAQLQFEEGLISNRDKVEAEDNLLSAQNALDQAKTARWGLLLEFRLATETLRVDEDGAQTPDPTG